MKISCLGPAFDPAPDNVPDVLDSNIKEEPAVKGESEESGNAVKEVSRSRIDESCYVYNRQNLLTDGPRQHNKASKQLFVPCSPTAWVYIMVCYICSLFGEYIVYHSYPGTF